MQRFVAWLSPDRLGSHLPLLAIEVVVMYKGLKSLVSKLPYRYISRIPE